MVVRLSFLLFVIPAKCATFRSPLVFSGPFDVFGELSLIDIAFVEHSFCNVLRFLEIISICRRDVKRNEFNVFSACVATSIAVHKSSVSLCHFLQ